MHCTLEAPKPHVAVPGTLMTPLVHSQLKSMTLMASGDHRLLNNLTLPALCDLEINFNRGLCPHMTLKCFW